MCIVCARNDIPFLANQFSSHEKASMNDTTLSEMLSMEDYFSLQCAVGVDCLASRKVSLPTKEHDCMHILRETKLLDTEAEEKYDRFTALAARSLKVSYISSRSNLDFLIFTFRFRYPLPFCQ